MSGMPVFEPLFFFVVEDPQSFLGPNPKPSRLFHAGDWNRQQELQLSKPIATREQPEPLSKPCPFWALHKIRIPFPLPELGTPVVPFFPVLILGSPCESRTIRKRVPLSFRVTGEPREATPKPTQPSNLAGMSFSQGEHS